MANDVFSETTTEEQVSPLDELVGEGKKFHNVEDLAKGKLEADSFIETLKQEKAQVMEQLERLKEEDSGRQTAKELLDELRASKTKDDSGEQTLTENDLEDRVRKILQGDSEKATAAQNREQGNKLVLEKFEGNVEAAKSFLAERASELGTTPAKLAELSETSPKLFAKAIDINPSTSATTVSALPGVNTGSMGGNSQQVDGVPTKAYFDKIKAEIGTNKYVNSPKIQKQYLDAAMKLGDRFYN